MSRKIVPEIEGNYTTWNYHAATPYYNDAWTICIDNDGNLFFTDTTTDTRILRADGSVITIPGFFNTTTHAHRSATHRYVLLRPNVSTVLIDVAGENGVLQQIDVTAYVATYVLLTFNNFFYAISPNGKYIALAVRNNAIGLPNRRVIVLVGE